MSSKAKVIGGVLCGVLLHAAAYAQNTDAVDPFSLQLSKAMTPSRFFIRAGAIAVKVKTKSGDTYDVTGPVATRDDLQALIDDGGEAIRLSILARDPVGGSAPSSSRPGAATVAAAVGSLLASPGTVSINRVLDAMDAQNITALGTPAGIKAVADENAATGGISLGYYLTDDYSWIVEAYVLAKPVDTSVAARGAPTYREAFVGSGPVLQPFGLDGQKIISTKLLPPVLMVGKYWGAKESKFRLYTGVIGMYAIFMDSKVTDTLNSFVGGSVPGATTVSLKNTFGLGPMLGAKMQVNDDWHVSVNVGSVKLKTQGSLVTRNTFITSTTGAIKEYGRPLSDGKDGGSITDTLQSAEDLLNPTTGTAGTPPVRAEIAKLGGATGVAMGAIAYNRGLCNAGGTCDLGAYKRKTDVTLQNTMLMLSVGRSF